MADADDEGKCDGPGAYIEDMGVDLIAKKTGEKEIRTEAYVTAIGPDDWRSFESAKLKKNNVILKIGVDSKFEDEGQVDTYSFRLDLKKRQFVMVNSSSYSPSQKERAELRRSLRAGNLAAARKLLNEMDYMPNGNTFIYESVAMDVLLNSLSVVKSLYQKKDFKKLNEWLDLFGRNTSDKYFCPFVVNKDEWQDSCFSKSSVYALGYNEYAFYFLETGNPKIAIPILQHVIEMDPSRTVAYLNLGDALWLDGQKEQASFYYKVYEARVKALSLAPPSLEIVERSKFPTKNPAFSEKEIRRQAGVEVSKFGDLELPNFDDLTAVPRNYFTSQNKYTEHATAWLLKTKKSFAIAGFPLSENSDFNVTRNQLDRGHFAITFEANGLKYRKGSAFEVLNGNVQTGILDGDTKFDGFWLKGGELVGFSDGKLALFTLREDQDVFGYPAAKDKPICLTWFMGAQIDASLTLSKAKEIYKYVLPPGSHLDFGIADNLRNRKEPLMIEVVTPDPVKLNDQLTASKFRIYSDGRPAEQVH